MRIQLPLLTAIHYSVRNAFLAAYTSCYHLTSVFTYFFPANVFFKKTPLFTKAGSNLSFLFAWQHRFQKLPGAVGINVHNVVKLKA